MRRYIVLLLITGIVWAQTDFDKLVLKDGTTYLGEYSKIEEEIVYFKPQNAFDFIPISVKRIQRLELKDGQFIIGSSSDILTNEENQKESLEENQELSTKNVVIIGCIIAVVLILFMVDNFKVDMSGYDACFDPRCD